MAPVPSSSSAPEGARRRGGQPRWRRWNRALHRDLGYLAVGLTLAYAVSGLAVNHVSDWNPDWTLGRETVRFEPMPVADRDTLVAELVRVLDLPEPKDAFRPAPERVQLFYDDWNVEADVRAGTAVIERPRRRAVLADLNALHLNRLRGAWTLVADAYAAVLAFLAVSGMLILRGRQGLAGRGRWLVLAGLAVPLVAIAWIHVFGSEALGR